MNIEALAARLELQDCGVVGKTLFTAEMPTGCIEGILLMGSYSGTEVNNELPGYFKTDFRLVVRGTVYAPALALAKKASAALKTFVGYTADTMLVRTCLPLNLPRPYRRSVGGYWEFEIDMDIVFVDDSE